MGSKKVSFLQNEKCPNGKCPMANVRMANVQKAKVRMANVYWQISMANVRKTSVPEAQEGGQVDVGMPGVGVVGGRGQGPSP